MFPSKRSRSSSLGDEDGLLWVDARLVLPEPTVAEARVRPDEAAAVFAVLEPGPLAVEVLGALSWSALSDTGLIDAVVAVDRQVAALQGLQQRFLAEAARRDPRGDRYLRDEVACALKLAPGTARERQDVALALTGRLSDTGDRMNAGRLSYAHGQILARATDALSDPVTGKVQERVLRRAEAQTPGEFRAAVRRAVAAFDTRDQGEQHAAAFADRKVVLYPEDAGMASIWLHLAADGAAAFMTALNACALKTDATDKRTADQRRADAAVDLAVQALRDPNLPKAHGLHPAVQVTVAATTLLGVDDQPAELDGYGPIPAGLARRIAEDPTGIWRRLITDPAGRLLDYTTTVYKPPVPLARHVIARDQHCVHPGCRRKARHCDLEHRIPYPHGHTNAHNLQPLCKRHHDLKHHSRWRVTKNPDGSYDWTSPTNHRYRYRPPELPTPTTNSTLKVVDDLPPPF